MSLVIDNRQQGIIIDDPLIKLMEKAAEEALKMEGWDTDYEVSLSLVDNNEIQALNKYYRGKDYATDVLSFPMVDEDSMDIGEKLLGDIVISVEKALQQANEYGHSFSREISFLLTHGMFHLMGYDHEDEASEAIMREKEEEILRIIQQSR